MRDVGQENRRKRLPWAGDVVGEDAGLRDFERLAFRAGVQVVDRQRRVVAHHVDRHGRLVGGRSVVVVDGVAETVEPAGPRVGRVGDHAGSWVDAQSSVLRAHGDRHRRRVDRAVAVGVVGDHVDAYGRVLIRRCDVAHGRRRFVAQDIDLHAGLVGGRSVVVVDGVPEAVAAAEPGVGRVGHGTGCRVDARAPVLGIPGHDDGRWVNRAVGIGVIGNDVNLHRTVLFSDSPIVLGPRGLIAQHLDIDPGLVRRDPCVVVDGVSEVVVSAFTGIGCVCHDAGGGVDADRSVLRVLGDDDGRWIDRAVAVGVVRQDIDVHRHVLIGDGTVIRGLRLLADRAHRNGDGGGRRAAFPVGDRIGECVDAVEPPLGVVLEPVLAALPHGPVVGLGERLDRQVITVRIAVVVEDGDPDPLVLLRYRFIIGRFRGLIAVVLSHPRSGDGFVNLHAPPRLDSDAGFLSGVVSVEREEDLACFVVVIALIELDSVEVRSGVRSDLESLRSVDDVFLCECRIEFEYPMAEGRLPS